MGSPVQRISHEEAASKVKLETSKAYVTLKVQGGDDHDVYYRLKRDFPLHHMKLDYCNRLGHQYGTVRFVYDGAKLSGCKTPEELQMKDGSAIDVFVDKIGG